MKLGSRALKLYSAGHVRIMTSTSVKSVLLML
jgi:hypothetical protein